MEVLQMIVFIGLIISILLTMVMTVLNMIYAKKRDKAYYKMLDEMLENAIKSFNERSEEE